MATKPSHQEQILRPRFLAESILEALTDTPVVAINGPRQAGKSTLAKELVTISGPVEFVSLDDRTQFDAARLDPHAFVEERTGTTVIDEVQRVPDLLVAIKSTVDRDRRPGRFVLTGSTRLLTTPKLSESLTGRIEIIELWPLSQGELRGRQEGFIDALFSWNPTLRVESELSRLDYAKSICRGGFPEATTREGKRRSSWFQNYATTVVERMVSEVADIERLQQMPNLLRLCAARTANELNVAAVANDLGAPARTVSAYLAHLQTVFMIDMLPAWTRNLTSKVSHRSKVIIVDSGVAAHVLGVNEQSLLKPESPIGQLLETFVIGELKKQLQWAQTYASMYHFRNRDGIEVDVVLEAGNGDIAGIEVKAASTVTHKDFRGLRLLQDRLGERFIGGVVLYAGKQTVPFGKRLAAIPISALWDVGT